MTICPLCLSIDGFECRDGGSWDVNNIRHECEVCGVFGTTWEARDDFLGSQHARTTKVVRAALSHWARLRQPQRNSDNIPLVTSELVSATINGDIQLPNPAEQAINIIRFIGDEVNITGEAMPYLVPKFHAVVGSVRREWAYKLLFELEARGLIFAVDSATLASYDALDIGLTLDGWQRYEAEQKGQTFANYGFMALKFGDEVLDPFLREHIKPAIESIGMQLRDMRDCSKAGIIDNLMRIEIRDSAFVLVDLTHDNPGAYWEAGYAEGLGKPVLYICERTKFDAAKTHFDTNHCTTVVWDAESPLDFRESLVATLKRSLVI